ncbi:MAG TPA: aminotransferase class V-fold PLP-dependent enzyme [Thermomicrobiales bacterium]|nr:aminotransferase class V-fold PLP-dependent enzyme [Thermomicrobiales bacterium]
MVDTVEGLRTQQTSIYDRIGVRTIINASGATTAVGGTLMPPEVTAAMAEAAQAFVVVEELNAAVGEVIARVTGAEAGYVTAGSAAGMLLAAAACITGTDRAKVKRLPQTNGMANELVIHRCQRINYDQMFRAAGATLVEIGLPRSTERWELEAAIGERTAAVVYIDSPSTTPGAIDFATVVEVAHSRGVPVIVDAASTLPPIWHLQRWISWAADLVIYSGGKGIRGPQDSGLLAGRKDLIAAAAMNGAPNAAIGRGMKVSKEAMAGLWVALERFMQHDHEGDFAQHLQQAEYLRANIQERSDARCELVADQSAHPAPILTVYPTTGSWNAREVLQALKDGTPSIHCKVAEGGLEINTHCLLPDEPEQILDRLFAVLDA